MLLRFLFCILFCSATSKEFELFCDWEAQATGNILFSADQNDHAKRASLPFLLGEKIREKGGDIRSWEMQKYSPKLLKFGFLQTFDDLLNWGYRSSDQRDLISEKTKYWMFWNLGPKVSKLDLSSLPKEKLVLVMWEPPTVQKELYDEKIQETFGKIFTWDDDLVDNKKFFKIYYPALKPRIPKIVPFREKKFCVMIARRLTSKHPKELYSKRKEIIKFFEEKPQEDFDLYGYYWKKKKRKNYRGALLSDKIEKLKEYKFSICYENMGGVKGYITEKIFDCFAAGVVPIYLGASNVQELIPKNCFIDRRDFSTNEELYQFLKNMTEEQYNTYIDATEAFLKSDSAKIFTAEDFLDRYLSNL